MVSIKSVLGRKFRRLARAPSSLQPDRDDLPTACNTVENAPDISACDATMVASVASMPSDVDADLVASLHPISGC
jgi:hypothetical protein